MNNWTDILDVNDIPKLGGMSVLQARRLSQALGAM